MSEFAEQTIDVQLLDDLAQLTRLAMREDLGRGMDLTTVAVVPNDLTGEAIIAARVPGVAAGINLVPAMVETMEAGIGVEAHIKDGEPFAEGQRLVTLGGNVRDILTCERTVLNFLGRLCGVSSWTARHVELISDLHAELYDTRKTTPGWRRLEKYAVACGGGKNHRMGLYDAVLIKDNHLACYAARTGHLLSPSEAVKLARDFVAEQDAGGPDPVVQIEVDTIDQLRDALGGAPDIVLLDNMTLEQLKESVQLRDEFAPNVQLEASGGVRLETIRSIAETGVDRISVGALTHSATNLDLGLDWILSP